jgi:hypothetical protein
VFQPCQPFPNIRMRYQTFLSYARLLQPLGAKGVCGYLLAMVYYGPEAAREQVLILGMQHIESVTLLRS